MARSQRAARAGSVVIDSNLLQAVLNPEPIKVEVMSLEAPVFMEGYTTSHDFRLTFFKQPTTCFQCDASISGRTRKQGYECSMHKKCEPMITDGCPATPKATISTDSPDRPRKSYSSMVTKEKRSFSLGDNREFIRRRSEEKESSVSPKDSREGKDRLIRTNLRGSDKERAKLRPKKSEKFKLSAERLQTVRVIDPESDDFRDDAALEAETSSLEEVHAFLTGAKISEMELWQGDPVLVPILNHFAHELRAPGEGSAFAMVNFTVKKGDFATDCFEGSKLYQMDTTTPIWLMAEKMQKRLEFKTPLMFKTLAGVELNGEKCLAEFGLGSLLKNWELEVHPLSHGAKGYLNSKTHRKLMKQKSRDLKASNSLRGKNRHVPVPSENPLRKFSILVYFARKHFSVRVQQVKLDDMTLARLAGQLIESYALPQYRGGDYVLTTMDDDALDMAQSLSNYGLGEAFDKWQLKLVAKEDAGLQQLHHQLTSLSAQFDAVKKSKIKFMEEHANRIEAEKERLGSAKDDLSMLNGVAARLERERKQLQEALSDAKKHLSKQMEAIDQKSKNLEKKLKETVRIMQGGSRVRRTAVDVFNPEAQTYKEKPNRGSEDLPVDLQILLTDAQSELEVAKLDLSLLTDDITFTEERQNLEVASLQEMIDQVAKENESLKKKLRAQKSETEQLCDDMRKDVELKKRLEKELAALEESKGRMATQFHELTSNMDQAEGNIGDFEDMLSQLEDFIHKTVNEGRENSEGAQKPENEDVKAPVEKKGPSARRITSQLKLEGNFKRGVSMMIRQQQPGMEEEEAGEALFDDWSFDEDEGSEEVEELDFWAESDDEDVFVINS